MKERNLVLDLLGIAFIAILCFALYYFSDGLYADFYELDQKEHWSLKSVSLLYEVLPFILLLVFFVYLKKDFPDSKSAKYALWVAVSAVVLLVVSHVLRHDIVETQQELINAYEAGLDFEKHEELEKSFTEYSKSFGFWVKSWFVNLHSGLILLVVAFAFALKTLNANKRLFCASLLSMIAVVFGLVPFTNFVPHWNEITSLMYLENSVIFRQLSYTFVLSSFAYLFYAYARKDEPHVAECGKFALSDWIGLAGLFVTLLFFFCNWIDTDFIPGKKYVCFGSHFLPFAAMGLAVIAIAVMAIIDRNEFWKKVAGVGLVIWPFVVWVATLMFVELEPDVESRLKKAYSLKILEEFVSLHMIIGYVVFSIGTGSYLIVDALRQAKRKKSAPSADDGSVESVELKAEVESLKEQLEDAER